MSQSANLAAINTYMMNQKPLTPAAAAVQTDWQTWYPKLSVFQRNLDGSVYDEARARRDLFNIKNATTPQQAAQVKEVLARGMTSEELSGQSPAQVAAAKQRVAAITEKLQTQGTNHPTIRQGSSGDAVKEWQKILGVNPDGKFGPATMAATKTWQKSKGLKDDGVVGPMTWNAAVKPKTPEVTGKIEEAIASIPAVFTPAPSTIPKAVGAPRAAKPVPVAVKPPTPLPPKPTAAAIAAAKKAGPAQATTVADGGGAVTGVKQVGESAMPVLTANASMIPMPAFVGKLPMWAKVGLGVVTAGLAVLGLRKSAQLAERR